MDFSKLGKRVDGVNGVRALNATPTTFVHPTPDLDLRASPERLSHSRRQFDFNHWDLVEARQLADIRPDYHMVKNYKFLGRFDTLLIKDADFFAYYRPWYDAEGTLKNKGRATPDHDTFNYTHEFLQHAVFQE